MQAAAGSALTRAEVARRAVRAGSGNSRWPLRALERAKAWKAPGRSRGRLGAYARPAGLLTRGRLGCLRAPLHWPNTACIIPAPGWGHRSEGLRVPRDIPVSNGNLLIAFDADYQIRDLYFPYVGQENHAGWGPCRFGVWADGQLA